MFISPAIGTSPHLHRYHNNVADSLVLKCGHLSSSNGKSTGTDYEELHHNPNAHVLSPSLRHGMC